MIALEALPAEARQAFQALQAENARLARINQLQAEQIRLLNLRLWGPKGEKFSAAQTWWLLEEASVTAQEIAQEAATPAAPTESPLPKAKPARGLIRAGKNCPNTWNGGKCSSLVMSPTAAARSAGPSPPSSVTRRARNWGAIRPRSLSG